MEAEQNALVAGLFLAPLLRRPNDPPLTTKSAQAGSRGVALRGVVCKLRDGEGAGDAEPCRLELFGLWPRPQGEEASLNDLFGIMSFGVSASAALEARRPMPHTPTILVSNEFPRSKFVGEAADGDGSQALVP